MGLISLGLAAVVAAGAAVASSRPAMAWLAALSVFAVLPLALAAAAGAANHDTAVNTLAVHLVGVTLWLGGLLALAVMRPQLGSDLGVTVQRYSTLALWSFVAVAVSGVLNAALRLGGLAGLDTAYGLLVVAKVLALVGLGMGGGTAGLTGRLLGRPGCPGLRASGAGRARPDGSRGRVAVAGSQRPLSPTPRSPSPPLPRSHRLPGAGPADRHRLVHHLAR